jgi:hypothetical protein
VTPDQPPFDPQALRLLEQLAPVVGRAVEQSLAVHGWGLPVRYFLLLGYDNRLEAVYWRTMPHETAIASLRAMAEWLEANPPVPFGTASTAEGTA